MLRATSFVPYLGLLALFIALRSRPADAAVAYDCSSTIRNMTTISLIDTDECDLKTDNVETSTEEIALLQLNEFHHIKIHQCKIDVKRIIFNCGMSSHSSIVSEGFHSYIDSISKADCVKAIETLSLNLNRDTLADLKLNKLNERSLTLAGEITNNGACSGAKYRDMFGSWENVAVTGSLTIVLKSEQASVKVEDDEVILPSGVHCKLSKGECIDHEGGYTFWDPLPKKNCSSNSYTKLYEGPATKFMSDDETVYTVNALDTTFSFTVAGSETSCNMTLLKTDSSKLFIVDSNNLKYLKSTKIVEKHTDNMDIFQYVNAKFVYVERHIRNEVKSLYSDVMKHYCRTEKKILANTLAIAATQPDEFAFRYMGGPGHMAVLAGEVVHIIQCLPIFQYVNAKFVYVERHIRNEVKSLYSDVMKHYCRTEKKILANTLAIAATQPDEFAFRYMGGPGHMAVLAGEVVHIIQCLPVEVSYRHVEKCYNRLPVSRGNDSMFLMPRTHILVNRANEIPCNGILLEHYKLKNIWYMLKPELVKAKEPLRLKQIAQMTWTYRKIRNLGTSGIYSNKDLDLLRETIMYPVEQVAIRETLSQQFSNNMEGPISIQKSLSDYVLNQMFPDLWSTIWTPFSLFGSVSAGLAGLFILLKLIKFFLDVLANAYMLYTVHGWSLHLFRAFSISLANVSLREAEKKEEETEEIMELIEKRKKLRNES